MSHTDKSVTDNELKQNDDAINTSDVAQAEGQDAVAAKVATSASTTDSVASVNESAQEQSEKNTDTSNSLASTDEQAVDTLASDDSAAEDQVAADTAEATSQDEVVAEDASEDKNVASDKDVAAEDIAIEDKASETSAVNETEGEAAASASASASAAVSASASAVASTSTVASAKDGSDKASGVKYKGEDVPHFKMGDDVSAYTGRPRITEEENRALAGGNRFFHKALDTAARARGESYEPFRLPPHMRAALANIDAESAQERMEEKKRQAEAEGKVLTDEEIKEKEGAIESFHKLSSEEFEELQKLRSEKESISAGGARFYGKYQALIEKQQERRAIAQAKVMRNVKIIGVVALGLVGYMAYSEFFVDRKAETIESLKAALPLTIDQHTSMVRIDDRTEDFKIYFEKDPAAYAGLDEHQKEAALDQVQKNAPGLCKNPLLHSIISSGRKVTVLLEATDRSFFRQYSIDKCPTSNPQ
ncbi:hypothetical protein [Anaerobiospirillum succiniciproducens]|uniref:hypothetical protein n=1 Tax=Anaerobiospirillum succiniciproducens TaxID=13335 RepID=UPI00041F38E0|nr:hypothetical protein [Anaerobiospirillum succiniciproducens]